MQICIHEQRIAYIELLDKEYIVINAHLYLEETQFSHKLCFYKINRRESLILECVNRERRAKRQR